jgi:hypothetical protein
MKAANEFGDNKSKMNQPPAERIHYKAFSHGMLTTFPGRDSVRVRITSRTGRALLIDMGP